MSREAFAYCHRPEVLGTSRALVARIPEGLSTKEQLLQALADGLRLPHWFGRNWDALEECLNDFAWLDVTRVVLFHEDVPDLPPDELTIYLEVLGHAVSAWQDEGELDLVVAFPVAAAERLASLRESMD